MDNKTTIDLSLANIERAAGIIDSVFRNTPQFIDEQLCAALGRRTIVKVETANPVVSRGRRNIVAVDSDAERFRPGPTTIDSTLRSVDVSRLTPRLPSFIRA